MPSSRVSPIRGKPGSTRRASLADAYELRLGATRLVAIYLGFAALWIVASDLAVWLFVEDGSLQVVIEAVKGIALVAVTAVLLYVLVRRDIRVIRSAEADLLAVNARLDEMADFPRLSPAPIVRLSPRGWVDDANAAATAAAVSGNVAELLPPGIAGLCAAALLTGEVPDFVEVQVGRRWFRWFLFPVSRRQCVYAYGVDCTAEHDFQAHLIQSEKVEIAGRLTAGLAHDFGNYVAAIKGHADLLLEDLPPGSPIRADLETIEEVASRATQMVRRLMTLGRDDNAATSFDLADNLRAMESLLRLLLRPDVRLQVTATDGPLRVHIDVGQFGRVLSNLVVNAGDAIDGVGLVTINAMPSADGSRAVIRVSDTGHGMDAETLARVWEPFFTTKLPGKGTGLGLPLAKQIIEEAGGSIDVESTPGRGTTFLISLPIDASG